MISNTTEASFQEKSIIWHTRKGSIDIFLITVMISLLLILPVFSFFVSAFSTRYMISEAKETLEIASLATYTKLNQESLGMGIIDIDEYSAEKMFYQQIYEIISENEHQDDLADPNVSIIMEKGRIIINSEITLSSAFKQSLPVKSSLEFLIDPTMEGV
ncbi:MAG: hypothetical protein ACYCYI_10935 [Saccharofermentanales bacterium]